MQSPKVQTYATAKVLDALNEVIDGDISIDRVHVRPFNALVIKNLVIVDRHPATGPDGQKVDTLARAGSVSATFSIKGLFRKEGLHLGTVRVKDGHFALVTEVNPDDPSIKTSNIKRVFSPNASPDKKKGKQKGNLFDADVVNISNFRYIMKNYREDKRVKPLPEGAINWKDLDVYDIQLKGKRLSFKDGVMSGTAERLSFKEKSGYICPFMSGKASVGNGKTDIKDLVIKDLWSDLSLPKLILSYDNMASWSDFLHLVSFDADIAPGRLTTKSLSYFAPVFIGKNVVADISGFVNGPVSDMSFSSLRLTSTDGEVNLNLDGNISGLPDIDIFAVNAEVSDVSFTTAGLLPILRGVAPKLETDVSTYAPGEVFHFNGSISGLLNSAKIKGEISSDNSGSLTADLGFEGLIEKGQTEITGNIGTYNLNVGNIAGIKAIGDCSLKSKFEASLGKEEVSVTIDTLGVEKLNALGYNYSGIAGAGKFEDNSFNGKVICNDPNLSFIFQGVIGISKKSANAIYRFYANIGYADLYALNIDKRNVSRVSLSTRANFNKAGEDLIGQIDLNNILFTDVNGRHDVGNISLSSHISNNVNRINLNSSFANVSYIGSKFINSFAKDIVGLSIGQDLPSLYKGKDWEWTGQNYKIQAQLSDTRDVLSMFKPGLYIEKGTSLDLSINQEGIIESNVKSGRIALNDKFLRNIVFRAGNAEGPLTGELTADELYASPLHINSNSLQLLAEKDHIGLGFTFDNNSDETNKGEFYITGDLRKSHKDSLEANISILPSNFFVYSSKWNISPTDIRIVGKNIDLGELTLSNEDQSIQLAGGISDKAIDTLSLTLNKFSLANVNPFLSEKMSLEGTVNGQAMLISPYKKKGLSVVLDIDSDSTTFAGNDLGFVCLKSEWNDKAEGFDLDCYNSLDGVRNIVLDGLFVPSKKRVDAEVKLDNLNAGLLYPFLNTLFSEMSGNLSGGISLFGPLNNLNIASKGTRLNDGLLRLDFTKCLYKADGPIRIDSQGIWFDDIALSDMQSGTGNLTGSVGWNNFKNMTLDTHVRFSNMEVLNTTPKDNSTFYGNVFGTGQVDITGPLNSITLAVNASTAKNGDFHIPMGKGQSVSRQSDLLTFKKEELAEEDVDPYEMIMELYNSNKKKGSNELNVKLNVRVSSGTEAYIEVDKATGNILQGRGSGNLEVEVRPQNELFTINGDYILSGGNYHFSAMNLASRDFAIKDGSSIRFTGDLMDSDLNIDAVYNTKTSIARLIADTTALTTRRAVECGIHISDRIKAPRISLSINVPDLDPATQTKVESALNTEDKVQKQFLSLLLTNSFLPDEQSGIVNNSASSMLFSNVTEIMANQLNNILQKFDIPVDLGLDYQQNSSGNDMFDVAVSTELFNSRVIVNGTIGNRQYENSTTNQEVVGDLDIEIKLDKPGTLRLNLFSHSADQYTSYLDNSQRNGIGLSYQREFNKFKWFVRSLFMSKKKREELMMSIERGELRMEDNVINISPEDKTSR